MDVSKVSRSIYPADLSAMLRHRWLEAGFDTAILPDELSLGSLMDTAYQASLLREESHAVQCRVMVASPADVEIERLRESDGLYIVEFDEQCDFTAHEVRKIAAAVGYYRSLIGIQFPADNKYAASIWGIVVTGTSWINQADVADHRAVALPDRLVIHIQGPGHLVFACGTVRVLETVGGRVLTEGFDPFLSEWLPRHFEAVRTQMLSKLDMSGIDSSKVRLCDSFVRDVAQNLVRRVLSLVRNRGHGGILIYLADEHDRRLRNWLRIRRRFSDGEATNRFQQLMLRLMQKALEVGATQGIAEVRWRDFQQMHDPALAKLLQAVVEFSHFLADLMGVDGALVLNREFRMVGFGGEILGDSHVSVIDRAIDLEAEQSVTEQADASGTRHRSAYRLVSSVQDSIAIVVSQDGAVRFVAYRGNRLVYWPYLP